MTRCLRNGLYLGFGLKDGKAGPNGLEGGIHGDAAPARLGGPHVSKALPGDIVVYGSGWPGKHTAIIVKQGRTPMAVSNGSEAGPFYLPYNYRRDVMSIRRYF